MLTNWAIESDCVWMRNPTLKDIVLSFIKDERILPTPLSIRDFTFDSIEMMEEKVLWLEAEKKSEETAKAFAKELKGMSDRLISRFQWGLSADIQAPDFETRIAILKNKSANFGISLSNEILDYIAYNITSNIRELEGCLLKLLTVFSRPHLIQIDFSSST